MTPPPTRQQTPTSPIVSPPHTNDTVVNTGLDEGNDAARVVTGEIRTGWPLWGVVLGQVVVTLPLYLFCFWVVIEGIKAGGDTLINFIDYLAFRP